MTPIEGKIPVTVIIPVKNEQDNLGRCLKCLINFTRVIVVDSSSTDRTHEIASNYEVDFFNFDWNGSYPKKRNWALLNLKIFTEWVFFLDADEIVTPNFCREMQEKIGMDGVSGFWINYKNYFLGRGLKYGISQRKLSLFKIGHGLYERAADEHISGLDMEVHEHPLINGPVGEINSRINHLEKNDLSKFLQRHILYADWEVSRILYFSVNPMEINKLTRRQQAKYNNISKWWFPWSYFIFTYLFKLGFMDGKPGLYYAFYKFWYFATIRVKAKSYSCRDGAFYRDDILYKE